MAYETEQGLESGNVAETVTETTQPTIEELQGRIAEYGKLEETRKTEIASLNRKVSEEQLAKTELLKANEVMKTSSLSENEQRELRIAKLENDIISERNSRTQADNKSIALKLMNDKGIDNELLDLLPFDNKEVMLEQLEKLTGITNRMIEKGAQSVVNKIGGSVPTGGAVPNKGSVKYEEFRTLSLPEQDKVLSENRLIR